MSESQNTNVNNNPLLLPSTGFALWLAGRGIISPEKPPVSIITRASLLSSFVNAGIIEADEIEIYFEEIGLMIPITEN